MGKLWTLMLYIVLAYDEVPYSVSELRKLEDAALRMPKPALVSDRKLPTWTRLPIAVPDVCNRQH